MRILLDHDIPRQIARFLRGHDASTTRENGWKELVNGRWLTPAEAAGFDCLLTGEQKLVYQNKFKGRKIAVVVVNTTKRRDLSRQMEPVMAALSRVSAGSFIAVRLEIRPLRRRQLSIRER